MIKLRQEELSKRGTKVQRLLRPLCQATTGPAYEMKWGRFGNLIIAVHEGSAVISHFEGWRFRTHCKGFLGSYYESWTAVDSTLSMYRLDKAYLTLFRKGQPGQSDAEREFICLHCDPNEPDSDGGRYKRGPHLHVKAAEYPIPKAHIALARGHLTDVLKDAGTLTRTMEWRIQMIRDEILDKIEGSHS